MKGWIATDIDGTITSELYSVPKDIVSYLRSLYLSGWNIFLTTGRSFTFALKGLADFDFPFYFSIQNGSAVLSMPDKKTLFTDYLQKNIMADIQRAMHEEEGVIIVYSGHSQGDKCFFLKEGLHPSYRDYVEKLMVKQYQEGVAVEDFTFPHFDEVSFVKCVGPHLAMQRVALKLQKLNSCSFSLIQDPSNDQFALLLITKKGVDKGSAFQKICLQTEKKGKIIVSGNDRNDLSLFSKDAWKIAMTGSPQDLLDAADFVAPPVEEMGILAAWKHALEKNI